MSKSYKVKRSFEDLRESKLIQELRKQIIKLKRENSQLKKKNARIENDYAEYIAEVELEESTVVYDIESFANAKKSEKDECPKCGAYEIVNFNVGNNKFYRCECCGSKGKVL